MARKKKSGKKQKKEAGTVPGNAMSRNAASSASAAAAECEKSPSERPPAGEAAADEASGGAPSGGSITRTAEESRAKSRDLRVLPQADLEARVGTLQPSLSAGAILATDWGLALDVSATCTKEEQQVLNSSLAAGVTALRNAAAPGSRVLLLHSAENPSALSEDLGDTLSALSPPVTLVPLQADTVLREQQVAYALAEHSLVLAVPAEVPVGRQLSAVKPIKSRVYVARSAGAGGTLLTWAKLSKLLRQTTPSHVGQPAPRIQAAMAPAILRQGDTFTRGPNSSAENFAEGPGLEYKQRLWYVQPPLPQLPSASEPFFSVDKEFGDAKYLYRLLQTDTGATKAASVIYGVVDKTGHVAGVPLTDAQIKPLKAKVEQSLATVFPAISRSVQLLVHEIDNTPAPIEGKYVAVGWTQKSVFAAYLSGFAKEHEAEQKATKAEIGCHVGVGYEAEDGDDDKKAEDGDDDKKPRWLLLFHSVADAHKYCPKSTVERPAHAAVKLVPLRVLEIVFDGVVANATPAHFAWRYDDIVGRAQEVSDLTTLALRSGRLERLTPPAMWAYLRAARDPGGLCKLWQGGRCAPLLVRDVAEGPWLFLTDGPVRVADNWRLLEPYLHGLLPLLVVVVKHGAADSVEEMRRGVTALLRRLPAGDHPAAADAWAPLAVAVACEAAKDVGRALQQLMAQENGKNSSCTVELCDAWLLDKDAMQPLLAQPRPSPPQMPAWDYGITYPVLAASLRLSLAAVAELHTHCGDLLVNLQTPRETNRRDEDLRAYAVSNEPKSPLAFDQLCFVPLREDAYLLAKDVKEALANGTLVATLHVLQCYAAGGATTVLRQVAAQLVRDNCAVLYAEQRFYPDTKLRLEQAAVAAARLMPQRPVVVILDTEVGFEARTATTYAGELQAAVVKATRADVTIVVVHATRWWPTTLKPSCVGRVLTPWLTKGEQKEVATFAARYTPESDEHRFVAKAQVEIACHEPQLHLAELLAAAGGGSLARLLTVLPEDGVRLLRSMAALSLNAAAVRRLVQLPLEPERAALLCNAAEALTHFGIDSHGKSVMGVPYLWAWLLLKHHGEGLDKPAAFLAATMTAIRHFDYDRLVIKELVRGRLPLFVAAFKNDYGFMRRKNKTKVTEAVLKLADDLVTLVKSLEMKENAALGSTDADALRAEILGHRKSTIALYILLSKMERLVTTYADKVEGRRHAELYSAEKCVEWAKLATQVQDGSGAVGFSATETLARAMLHRALRTPDSDEAAAGMRCLDKLCTQADALRDDKTVQRLRKTQEKWSHRLRHLLSPAGLPVEPELSLNSALSREMGGASVSDSCSDSEEGDAPHSYKKSNSKWPARWIKTAAAPARLVVELGKDVRKSLDLQQSSMEAYHAAGLPPHEQCATDADGFRTP